MICEYTGAKYAHMVPSATAGLLIAAMLADLQRDEFFVAPAYTQAATVNGAILLGGHPRFVDVNFGSFDINWEQIPKETRVIFVAAINGRYHSSTPDRFEEARNAGKFIIEDAAQALGSWCGDKHIGTMGDVGVFSFGAPKIITTGQGGCIITNRDDLNDRIIAIKNFGRSVGITGETYNVMGLNFKFTDLQAAFGVEQMKRLPQIVERKKRIYEIYREELKNHVEFVETNLKYTTPTYPEILVSTHEKTLLMEYLSSHDIGTRSVYKSLSAQPFHHNWARPSDVTDWIYTRGIQLPSQSDMTDDDVKEVCRVVKSFFYYRKFNPDYNVNVSRWQNYVYQNVDRICLIIVGQPRYMGSAEWEAHFVERIKDTVREHNVPIDLIVAAWEYDTISQELFQSYKRNPDGTNTGLPVKLTDKHTTNDPLYYDRLVDLFYKGSDNINYKHTGKIHARKKEFEQYIHKTFDFVSTIKVMWEDPFDYAQEYALEMQKYVKNHPDEFPYYNVNYSFNYFLSMGLYNQHIVCNSIYQKNKKYFDSLTRNSVIIKTRPDIAFSQNNIDQHVNLWNIAGLMQSGFAPLDGLHCEAPELNQHNFYTTAVGEKVDLHPMVLITVPSNDSVIMKGTILASDYMHCFDNVGFKIYATEFKDWVFEDPYIRFYYYPIELSIYKNKKYVGTEQYYAKAEVQIHSFFLDKKFSIKYSNNHTSFYKHPVMSLFRQQYPEVVDMSRWLWYEWDQKMLNYLLDED
jgi:perosamine synthetase